MQVEVVRHHRRAENPDGDVEHGRIGHDLGGWNQSRQDLPHVRLGQHHLGGEAGSDGGDERAHDRFEPAETAILQQQDHQHIASRQYHAPEQRNMEQQVEGNGGTDHFGEVARRDGNFAENPESEGNGAGEVIAAGLGEVAPGDDAELEGESLQQDRHQVRDQHDAQQGVAQPQPYSRDPRTPALSATSPLPPAL